MRFCGKSGGCILVVVFFWKSTEGVQSFFMHSCGWCGVLGCAINYKKYLVVIGLGF